MSEWEWVSEWVNEWVSEWVLACVCACVHDWVNEWLSEWDIDLVNQFFSHDMHRIMGDSHWKNVVQITKVQLTVIQPIKARNVHGRTFCYWGHLKRQTLKLTLVQRFSFLLMKIDGSNQKFQFSFFPFRNHNTNGLILPQIGIFYETLFFFVHHPKNVTPFILLMFHIWNKLCL